jgi:hypothetical protein
MVLPHGSAKAVGHWNVPPVGRRLIAKGSLVAARCLQTAQQQRATRDRSESFCRAAAPSPEPNGGSDATYIELSCDFYDREYEKCITSVEVSWDFYDRETVFVPRLFMSASHICIPEATILSKSVP